MHQVMKIVMGKHQPDVKLKKIPVYLPYDQVNRLQLDVCQGAVNMKKKILLILLFGISFIMCGCANNIDSAEKMDDIVLSLLRNKTYETKGLSKNEIKLINDFINKEKADNKIINLNLLSSYSDLDYENNADSQGVYEDNGIYYIKYSDIAFEEINASACIPKSVFAISAIYLTKLPVVLETKICVPIDNLNLPR